MHTLSLLCSMSRLPHLTVCLFGALLLMSLCRAETEKENDFEEPDTTPDYDYPPTFDYTFFSNASIDDLDRFLLEAGDTGDVELDTDTTPSEEEMGGEEESVDEEEEEEETVEIEVGEEEVTITKPPTHRRAPTAEACRTTPLCLVTALGLIAHQLARLL